MTGPCKTCGHSQHDHEDAEYGGRCCANAPGGKARPCPCDACADALRLHGLEPRCGCLVYVATPAPRVAA